MKKQSWKMHFYKGVPADGTETATMKKGIIIFLRPTCISQVTKGAVLLWSCFLSHLRTRIKISFLINSITGYL